MRRSPTLSEPIIARRSPAVTRGVRPLARIRLQEVVVLHAGFDDLDRRDAKPLVEDLLRVAREAAGRESADLGHVPDAGYDSDALALVEDGFDNHVLRQVVHPRVRVVVQEHVVRAKRVEPELVDDPLQRHRRRAELRRAELALPDHLADLVEDGAREVEHLVEDRRVGGRLHRLAHLARHGDEVVRGHGHRDRVNGTRRGRLPLACPHALPHASLDRG